MLNFRRVIAGNRSLDPSTHHSRKWKEFLRSWWTSEKNQTPFYFTCFWDEGVSHQRKRRKVCRTYWGKIADPEKSRDASKRCFAIAIGMLFGGYNQPMRHGRVVHVDGWCKPVSRAEERFLGAEEDEAKLDGDFHEKAERSEYSLLQNSKQLFFQKAQPPLSVFSSSTWNQILGYRFGFHYSGQWEGFSKGAKPFPRGGRPPFRVGGAITGWKHHASKVGFPTIWSKIFLTFW